MTGNRLVLFENVMLRLLYKVNQSARAAFGVQIADMDGAPQNIVSALALDESIEVAGPILSRSDAIGQHADREREETRPGSSARHRGPGNAVRGRNG